MRRLDDQGLGGESAWWVCGWGECVADRRLALPVCGSPGPGSVGRVAVGQVNAVRSRWKPSAIWTAQRQVLSIRSQVCRLVRVSRAATWRTR